MINPGTPQTGSVVAIAKWLLLAFSFMLLCSASSAQPVAFGISQQVQQGPTSPVIAAEDILAQISSGEPLNYDNVTITGQLDLTKLSGPVKQSVKITNSRFLGPMNFNAISFDGALDLRGSVFQENASFAKSSFLGDVSLSGAKFRGQADFQNSHFGGQATFISALFLNDTSFGNAQFDGDAVFLNSGFARDVDYNFAQFFRIGSFGDTIFENVSFLETQFDGHTSFLDTKFLGNATFAATSFASDVVFRDAEFLRGSTFGLSSFGGLADFAGVDFKETAYFGGVKFADLAYFVSARFDKDLILEESRLYSMQLDNVTFLEGSTINLNNADFTKFVVHWAIIKDRLEYNGAAYLALVRNYKSLEWFDDADECYYQYRRIGQNEEPWGWSKLSDIISWLSCGYGVRVSYTVFWCIFTILFFGMVFWAGNGMRRFEQIGLEIPSSAEAIQKQRVSLVDALYFSVAMFTTSQAPVNNYPVGVYRHLAMFEGILGWFFLGLFVVVLSGVLIR